MPRDPPPGLHGALGEHLGSVLHRASDSRTTTLLPRAGETRAGLVCGARAEPSCPQGTGHNGDTNPTTMSSSLLLPQVTASKARHAVVNIGLP